MVPTDDIIKITKEDNLYSRKEQKNDWKRISYTK